MTQIRRWGKRSRHCEGHPPTGVIGAAGLPNPIIVIYTLEHRENHFNEGYHVHVRGNGERTGYILTIWEGAICIEPHGRGDRNLFDPESQLETFLRHVGPFLEREFSSSVWRYGARRPGPAARKIRERDLENGRIRPYNGECKCSSR